MTGSGKTALIQKLVELLAHKKLYAQMDMGEFESDSASWIKSTFTDELEYFHQQPGIICLDEFQFAKTIDNGRELGKDKLRVIWDLLDSGKINYIPGGNTFMLRRSDLALLNLIKAKDAGVCIENGVIIKNISAFLDLFKGFYFNSDERDGVALDANYFLSKDFRSGLYYLYDDENMTRELIDEKVKMADLEEIIELIMDGVKTRTGVKQLDLSGALIFVLGNLDEAYYMSNSRNPDISADELYEASSKINISHIKGALKKRFRNEQIARFGNNHVIYTSFTNAHFKELIKRELQRVNDFVKLQFDFSLVYDASVHDVVYREGVFPAQGTRPVLTTVKNLIEAWVSKIVVAALEKNMPVATVEWNYYLEKYVFVYKDASNTILNIYEEKIELKIDSLRKTTNRNTQAYTAVHEAGHAVLAALTFRILPSLIVSKTAGDNCEGFCMVNLPEGATTNDTLRKDIIITLGGFVAEKMIFGEEHTTPNLTLCTNGGPCLTLNATSSLPSANFNWQPVNQNGSSISVCPTASSQYTIYATSPASGTCPSSVVVSVTYTTGNCCPNPPPTLIPLTNINGTYSNNSYLLDNTQGLMGNTYFVNSEVWVTPGVQLTVPAGRVLDLENTHIFACGINMWQGIKILDGGQITTSNTRFSNTMIEDAEVAIELDGINSANVMAGQPAINISRVIFNKNYIGIRVSNSDPMLDSLALGITGCVFSSRDMPFSSAPNALVWPSASNSIFSGGLRFAGSPTTGLVSPYSMNGYSQANLKFPHNFLPGHIGIKIEKIGDPNGFNATPGVQFGITYLSWISPDFNLFDGLGNGIDVTDASLTAANNVFQNSQQYLLPPLFTSSFGGDGIRHEITGIRNARLKLTSLSNTSDGNQFWNCHKGVEALNVFELRLNHAIFRSDHSRFSPDPYFLLGLTQGDIGIECTTNRFDFNVQASEFNNVRQGIAFNTPSFPQQFDMTGSNVQTGIFAQGFNVQQNYFGSQVSSAVPIPIEYMSDAIVVQTPLTSGWQNNTTASYISSNKFNRIYRGVHINGMSDHPMFIGGNEFLLEDDYIYGPPDFAWGVKVENNMDNMAIANNTVQGSGLMPFNEVSAILCKNNYGVMSPVVSCNLVLDSKFGFEFSGMNPNTVWRENEMCNHFAGLALTNNGIIGNQGGLWGGNSNLWRNACTWAPGVAPLGNWQTYCENSDPNFSPLYVYSLSAVFEPTIHGFFPALNPVYSNGPTVIPVTINTFADCMVFSPYPSPPSWRSTTPTALDEAKDEKSTVIQIYPNPTKGTVFVTMPNSEGKFKVSVRDLTGKLLMDVLSANAHEAELNLTALPAGVYFLEIHSNDKNVIHKKIIKLD